MATDTPTIEFSILDRSAASAYHRYALAFTCADAAVGATTKRLDEAVRKAVTEIPILAGTVSSTEASVTIEQVRDYAIKVVKTDLSYADLCTSKIAPRLLFGEALSPMADLPRSEPAPACAMQANFLEKGLVLVIYLHKALADIKGIGNILRIMSEGLPARYLDARDLIAECSQASRERARFSDSQGAVARMAYNRTHQHVRQAAEEQEAATQQHAETAAQQAVTAATNLRIASDSPKTGSAVISFKRSVIETTTSLVNNRRDMGRHYGTGRNVLGDGNVSEEQVLIGYVWKMLVRAKFPNGSPPDKETTSLAFKVDVRNVIQPPLEPDFFGNAEITAYATGKINDLDSFYDVDGLFVATNAILSAITKASSDLQVRSTIALLDHALNGLALDDEATDDVSEAAYEGSDTETTDDHATNGLTSNPPVDYIVNSFTSTYPSAVTNGDTTPTRGDPFPVGGPPGRFGAIAIPRSGSNASTITGDTATAIDTSRINPRIDLGLGLGNADAVRRIGHTIAGNEVTILPPDRMRDAWEVQVELEQEVLDNIYNDTPLMGFVWDIAR